MPVVSLKNQEDGDMISNIPIFKRGLFLIELIINITCFSYKPSMASRIEGNSNTTQIVLNRYTVLFLLLQYIHIFVPFLYELYVHIYVPLSTTQFLCFLTYAVDCSYYIKLMG